METIEEEIKKAEHQKLVAESKKAFAEKEKIELEKLELERRLLTPFLRSKPFAQAIVAAFVSIPLIWFYFENIVQPYMEHKEYEVKQLSDSLDVSIQKYKKDTINFTLQNNQLQRRIIRFDSTNKRLLISLNELQAKNSELSKVISKMNLQIGNLTNLSIRERTDLNSQIKKLTNDLEANKLLLSKQTDDVKKSYKDLGAIPEKPKEVIDFGLLNDFTIILCTENEPTTTEQKIEAFFKEHDFKGKISILKTTIEDRLAIGFGGDVLYSKGEDQIAALEFMKILKRAAEYDNFRFGILHRNSSLHAYDKGKTLFVLMPTWR